jgi:hypothetical protein
VKLENILEKNKNLKNVHAGKRCFIIGNGPSLIKQDISLLTNEITIVVSWFHRHPDTHIIKPPYWVVADPAFWSRSDQPFLPAIKRVTDLEMNSKLFVPTGGFNYFAGLNTGSFIDLHFFHYEYQKTINSLIDFTKGIPPFGQNVVLVALMLAFHMGCNPVYFVGCDHDFLNIKKEEYLSKIENHFYAEATPANYSEEFSWEEFSACMSRLRMQYDQLKLYASIWGFNVFNATRGGCLEIFPRVEYESLFPDRNQSACSLSEIAIEPSHLGEAAIKLTNSGDIQSALALIDEALRRNISRRDRMEGLDYLKAICLARLGKYGEALLFARQDRDCNPTNRENSVILIQQLEKNIKGCSVQ